jgi:hypothetical protein
VRSGSPFRVGRNLAEGGVRRASVVVLIVLVAAVAARVAAPAHERPARFSAALACGVERWGIKTLKDRPRLLRARPTTVAHLTAVPRPASFRPGDSCSSTESSRSSPE